MRKGIWFIMSFMMLFNVGFTKVYAESTEYKLKNFYITVPSNFIYQETDYSITMALENGLSFSDTDPVMRGVVGVEVFSNYFLEIDDTLDFSSITEESAELFWEFYEENLGFSNLIENGFKKIGNMNSYYSVESIGDGSYYIENDYIFYGDYLYKLTTMVSEKSTLEADDINEIRNSVFVGERPNEYGNLIYFGIVGGALLIGISVFVIRRKRKKDIWSN